MPFDATTTSIHRTSPRVKRFVIGADDALGRQRTGQFERDDPDEDLAARPATSKSTATTGSTDSIETAPCGVPGTVVDTEEPPEDLGVGDDRVFSEGRKDGEGED